MIHWKDVLLGAVSFLGAHLVQAAAWRRWFDPAGQFGPWFLNSGRAVAFTAACLFVAGVAAALRCSDRRNALIRGAGVAAGALCAMVVTLFATGPGTLFPIVIVIGGGMTIASAVAGALAGWLLSRRTPG